MPNVIKKMYHGQPGTGITTCYTAQANTLAIIKNIVLTNTTATDATISIHVTATSATANSNANAIIATHTVPARNTIVIELSTVMEANNSIRALQGTAGSITAYISGVEVS